MGYKQIKFILFVCVCVNYVTITTTTKTAANYNLLIEECNFHDEKNIIIKSLRLQ